MKVNLINEETFRFDSLDQNKQENKEYVLSMENFWVILKEKHPKEYYSGFAV